MNYNRTDIWVHELNKLYRVFLKKDIILTFKRRIKSRLPFAGIIRSSPYLPRFQDKGQIREFQKNIMKYK